MDKEEIFLQSQIKELRQILHQCSVELALKNRELEIEAALERVRARAMGMQTSDELKALIATMFFELTELDLVLTRCTIMIFDTESNASTWWMANSETPTDPIGLNVKNHQLPPYISFLEAWQERENKFVYILQGKDKNDWDNFLFTETELSQLPDFVIAGMKVPFKVYLSASFNNFGCLNLASLEPLSDEQFGILLRFAKVFDLTYTRFNDLQKAETQAREAQIEVALEKVRNQSLGMRKSQDIKFVVNVIDEKLKELGLSVSGGICITIFQENSRDFLNWILVNDGEVKTDEYYQAYFDSTVFKDFHAAREGGLQYVNKVYGELDSKDHMKRILDQESYQKAPKEIREWLLSQTTYCYAAAFMQRTGIFIFYFDGILLSEEMGVILTRFSSVFEQAYTRFLDLQKAEVQTREAQIEAALERVRSRTMAMQKSSELAETVRLLFEEFKKFETEPDMANLSRGFITIINHEKEWFDLWITDVMGNEIKQYFKIDFIEPTTGIHIYQGWKNKQPNVIIDLAGEELNQWLDYLSGLGFPVGPGLYGTRRTNNFIYHSNGFIGITSSLPLTEESLQLLERFAKVFDLTYTRFADLQNAEAQAREAQIEAALERVRSRTLAMQKSDELAETAAEVFRQLIALGIEPNRLYIGIIKGETGDMEMWATDEDGSQIGKKFMFNKDENASVKKLYDGWFNKQVSVIVNMEGKELEDYLHYLNHVMQIPFRGGLTQTRRVQSVAYFSKGFIGMASPDGQGDETIQLLERFAAVFNLTFTRFNDLKIAEAHADQAEKDLILLKAEKKRTEEALNELQLTQKQLIQSEKMASLGELTAGIAHEIQNPLNFVNNFSEVSNELIDEMKIELDKGEIDIAKEIAEDVKQNLEKIYHHGKRADAIVKGMLQHSRTGTGKKESVDINALCDEYLRLAYHGLRAKDNSFNVTLVTDFDPTIQTIQIQSQEMGRVILNLINNALYAVGEKRKQNPKDYEPKVTIRTKRNNQSIEISVEDNGMGIPTSIKDKIFQPFFTTKPTGQGTGLGLSLSYDIVKAHGGEIQVETPNVEGTIFSILLPQNQ